MPMAASNAYSAEADGGAARAAAAKAKQDAADADADADADDESAAAARSSASSSSAADVPMRRAVKALAANAHVLAARLCADYAERRRRHAHVTPRSYLAFLSGYRDLYAKKWAAAEALAQSVDQGLSKMASAKQEVGKLRVELAAKTAELAAAGAEAEKMLRSIGESTAEAERERRGVAAIVAEVGATAARIAAQREEAAADLAAAQPALEEALAALNSIQPKDITALKSLKSPPDVVKRIFDAVLILRGLPLNPVAWRDSGKKAADSAAAAGAAATAAAAAAAAAATNTATNPSSPAAASASAISTGTSGGLSPATGSLMVLEGSFDQAVKMMGDMQLLSSLLQFPKEAITDETVELLQPYFAAPDFNYAAARKASGNVAGLCNWAAAMCKYHAVAKVVEPKTASLRAAEQELRGAAREKEAADARMAAVQGRLDEARAAFDAAMAAKARLEEDAAAARRRMDAAAALLQALSGEEQRWTRQSSEFGDRIRRLTGDCAVAAAFVAYGGPFDRSYRDLLLGSVAAAGAEAGADAAVSGAAAAAAASAAAAAASGDEGDAPLPGGLLGACAALGVPVTPDLDVTRFLADDAELGEWVLQGLPPDDLSLQSGALVARAPRHPLLVDPQGQGRAWVAAREASRGLIVVSAGDARRLRPALEEALRSGRPLLIEDVGDGSGEGGGGGGAGGNGGGGGGGGGGGAALDPILDPVLERRMVRRGRSWVMVIGGDKEIDVDESFRLYMTTR